MMDFTLIILTAIDNFMKKNIFVMLRDSSIQMFFPYTPFGDNLAIAIFGIMHRYFLQYT